MMAEIMTVWFDYVRLEEDTVRTPMEEEDAAVNKVSDVYERAIAQIPSGQEKRHWRRYVHLCAVRGVRQWYV